jgi:hypothetical protein
MVDATDDLAGEFFLAHGVVVVDVFPVVVF